MLPTGPASQSRAAVQPQPIPVQTLAGRMDAHPLDQFPLIFTNCMQGTPVELERHVDSHTFASDNLAWQGLIPAFMNADMCMRSAPLNGGPDAAGTTCTTSTIQLLENLGRMQHTHYTGKPFWESWTTCYTVYDALLDIQHAARHRHTVSAMFPLMYRFKPARLFHTRYSAGGFHPVGSASPWSSGSSHQRPFPWSFAKSYWGGHPSFCPTGRLTAKVTDSGLGDTLLDLRKRGQHCARSMLGHRCHTQANVNEAS